MNRLAALTVFALVPAPAAGADRAPTPRAVGPGLVVADVTVIDVAAGKPVPGMTVVVRGDRIAAVVPAAGAVVPPGAVVVDGTGKFLIPGLWDMHVHLVDASFPGWFLRYGVTGVRHLFSVGPFRDDRRPADPAAGPPHPRVVAANQALDGPDTAFTGLVGGNVVKARDAKDAPAAVRAIREAGNDFLKVYPALPRDAYFAAVREADRLGLPVAGHVPREVTVEEASAAGQHTVEHLNGVAVHCSTLAARLQAQLRGGGRGKFDATTGWRVEVEAHGHFDPDRADALFRTFVRNATWHVPTLVQTRQMARLGDPHPIPPGVERELPPLLGLLWRRDRRADGVSVPRFGIAFDRTDLRAREALLCGDSGLVRRMNQLGVRLLAGTDAGTPFVVPGWSLHEELALLAGAGLTPAEALRTATLNPARCLGLDDRLGTVEVGKYADLVLLGKNPLDDILHTRAIEAVVVGGRVVRR